MSIGGWKLDLECGESEDAAEQLINHLFHEYDFEGTPEELNDLRLRHPDFNGNPEHLRRADPKLSGESAEGVEWEKMDLSGACVKQKDFRGAKLQRVNLSGCDLRKADFSNADIRSSDLSHTDLRGATVDGTDFTYATLEGAKLQQLSGKRAIFRNVQARGANFKRAFLPDVDFTNADLREAKFTEVKLTKFMFKGLVHLPTKATIKGALLDRAKLYGTSVFYDSNPVEETRFSGNANDPYHVLRRGYTGANLFVCLLLSLFALVPIWSKLLVGLSLSQSETTLARLHSQFEVALVETEKRLPGPVPENAFQPVRDLVDQIDPSTSKLLTRKSVFSVVLALDQPVSEACLVWSVIAFNALRILVTWAMASRREEEERGARMPKLDRYLWIYRFHLACLTLMLFAGVAFLFNMWTVLTSNVYVPA